jgi:hypothetical protein
MSGKVLSVFLASDLLTTLETLAFRLHVTRNEWSDPCLLWYRFRLYALIFSLFSDLYCFALMFSGQCGPIKSGLQGYADTVATGLLEFHRAFLSWKGSLGPMKRW